MGDLHFQWMSAPFLFFLFFLKGQHSATCLTYIILSLSIILHAINLFHVEAGTILKCICSCKINCRLNLKTEMLSQE